MHIGTTTGQDNSYNNNLIAWFSKCIISKEIKILFMAKLSWQIQA